ncbi:MAG TPA: hypothetical protein VFV34_05850 [Blastocatellia bacterium]|nr:hypothetical protein [Blastocatellia bacterium]
MRSKVELACSRLTSEAKNCEMEIFDSEKKPERPYEVIDPD